MGMLKRSGWLLVLFPWGLWTRGSCQLAAQEADLPEPVTNALVRLGELKTFSVSWSEYSRASTLTREKLESKKEPSKRTMCLLVWQGGKLYYRRNVGGLEWKDAPNARRQEFAFDGRVYAAGSPDQMANGERKSPNLVIDLAENKEPQAGYFGVRDFEPVGIRLPHGAAELLQVKQLTSQVLFLLEHGGRLNAVGETQIDGRLMTRISIFAENPMWHIVQKEDLGESEKLLRQLTTMTEEQIQQKLALAKKAKEMVPRQLEHVYYLDPGLGYCVRRYQQLSKDGRLRIQFESIEHQKLPGHEIWLARKWLTDHYVADSRYPGETFDKPLGTTVREISEFETKPVPEEQFTLRYTIAGTNVTDLTLRDSKLGKAGVSYKVPARPEDLDRVIEEARKLGKASGDWGKRDHIFKNWLMILNVVAFAGLVVYLVIRHRRRVSKS